MAKQNFIAGKGFSVEDDDGIVTSFLEINSGNNVDLKNITTLNQRHTYLGQSSKKNDYILVAKTTFTSAIQNATLGDYTQTLGVFPQLPVNSLNIIKANIVATNKNNTTQKYAFNYDISCFCSLVNSNPLITEISDIQTVFTEEFPSGNTWSAVPYYDGQSMSFACTGNPGTVGQEVIWMIYMEIMSSTFI